MWKKLLPIFFALAFIGNMCANPMITSAQTTAIFDDGRHVELMIHGQIHNAQDEINLRAFSAGDLESIKIIINSPGGDVVEMMGMMMHIEDLKANGVHVTTEVTGRALSAGAFLWLLGDERIVNKGSKLMFHKPAYVNAYGAVDCSTLHESACWALELDTKWGYDLLRSIASEKVTDYLYNDKNVYINGQGAFDLGLATEIK